MKKMWKRFWTLSKRQSGGFTLVELIVVIAILAILAGVAVPAYSGYVKKADRAADEVLLNAVNKAFASACMMNGESNFNRTDSPSIALTDGKVEANSLTIGNEKIATSFATFFEGGEFKVATYLKYDAGNGVFTAPELDGEGARTVLKAGYDWSNLAALKEIFQQSKYYDAAAEDGGISALTGTVDNLTHLLTLAGDVTTQLAEMSDFQKTMEALGIDEGSTDKQELANAAVFFVADKLKGLDAGAVQDAMEWDANMGGTQLDDYLKAQCGLVPGSNEAQFVKTALQYGVLQSYVNALPENSEDTIDGVLVKEWFYSHTPTDLGSSVEFITKLTQTASYRTYISSEEDEEIQADKDINAFLGILGAVGENKGAFETVSGEGLFSNSDVQGVLQGNLTGGGN